ncbi:hypothetical protein [Thermostaphylospora chromogena]|uniref:Uncharacterized protein n=1 Tax=Thermostaphylospora chromogena TaxID=35622 RepID=A0A1H1HPW9_9ACTN|nr:hypothetical protein [Thermostaphylospora chromogena]SDR27158.1 hypothetical protein SAMN04489764_4655 [Thermostaphylospora chromogena]
MKPHAEVEQVWPEGGRIRVLGRLHGLDGLPRDAASGDGWQAVLLLREPRGPQLVYPVPVVDRSFELTVPIADLIVPQAPARGCWDLYLSHGETRLRVGRHLDDIRNKASIMVYPEQLIPDDERLIHVRPRYTINENLSIDYWSG